MKTVTIKIPELFESKLRTGFASDMKEAEIDAVVFTQLWAFLDDDLTHEENEEVKAFTDVHYPILRKIGEAND